MNHAHTYEGGCHCGSIRYQFTAPFNLENMPVRTCSCSFCIKSGGRYTAHPEGHLTVTIQAGAQTTRYRFGHQTADFHICKTCGGNPYVSCTIENRLYAVLNVNSLDQADHLARQLAPVKDFSGEQPEDRLQRRKQGWIANVTIKKVDT